MAGVIRPSKELPYDEFAAQAIAFQEQEQQRIQAELEARQKEQERRIKQTMRVKRVPSRNVQVGRTIQSAKAKKRFEGVTELDVQKAEQQLQQLGESQQAELESVGQREYEEALAAKPVLVLPQGIETPKSDDQMVSAFSTEKKGVGYDEYGEALSSWLEEYKTPLSRGEEKFQATQTLITTENQRISDINKQQYEAALKKKPTLSGKGVTQYSKEFNEWVTSNESILGRNYDDAQKIIEESNTAVDTRITTETKSDTDLALKQMASFSSPEGMHGKLVSGKSSTFRAAYVPGWGFFDSPYMTGIYEELNPTTMEITVKYSDYTKKPWENSQGYSLQRLEGGDKVLGTYKLGQSIKKEDFLTTVDGKQVLKSDAEVKKVFESIKGDETLYNPDRIEKGYLDLSDQWGKKEHASAKTLRQNAREKVAELKKEEAEKRGPSGIDWYNPYTGKGHTGFSGGFYSSAPTKTINIPDTMKADNVRLTDEGTWVRYDADAEGFKRKDYGITLTETGKEYASGVELAKDKVVRAELKLDNQYFKDFSEAKTNKQLQSIKDKYTKDKLAIQTQYEKIDPLMMSDKKKAIEITSLLKEGYSPATAANVFFTSPVIEDGTKIQNEIDKLVVGGLTVSQATTVVSRRTPVVKDLKERADIIEPVKMRDIATTNKTGVGAGALAGVKGGATSFYTDFSQFSGVKDIKDITTGKDVSDVYYDSLFSKSKAIDVMGEGLITPQRVFGDISQPILGSMERDIIGTAWSVKDSEKKLKAYETKSESARKSSKIDEVNKELEELGKKQNYKADLRVYQANPTQEGYDKIKPYLDIVEKIDNKKLAEYNATIVDYKAELSRYKNSATKQQQQIFKAGELYNKLQKKEKEIATLEKRTAKGEVDINLAIIQRESVGKEILSLRGEYLDYVGIHTMGKRERQDYLGVELPKKKSPGLLTSVGRGYDTVAKGFGIELGLESSAKKTDDFFSFDKNITQDISMYGKTDKYRSIAGMPSEAELMTTSFKSIGEFKRGVDESKDPWYIKGWQKIGADLAYAGRATTYGMSSDFSGAKTYAGQWGEFFETKDFIDSRDKRMAIEEGRTIPSRDKFSSIKTAIDYITPDFKLTVDIKTKDSDKTYKKDTFRILDIDTTKKTENNITIKQTEGIFSNKNMGNFFRGAENWFEGAEEYYKYKPLSATKSILIGAGFAAVTSGVGSFVGAGTLSTGLWGGTARVLSKPAVKVIAGVGLGGAYIGGTEIQAFQITDIKERQKFRGEKYLGEMSAFVIGAGAFSVGGMILNKSYGLYDPKGTFKGKTIRGETVPMEVQKTIIKELSIRYDGLQRNEPTGISKWLTYSKRLSQTSPKKVKLLTTLKPAEIVAELSPKIVVDLNVAAVSGKAQLNKAGEIDEFRIFTTEQAKKQSMFRNRLIDKKLGVKFEASMGKKSTIKIYDTNGKLVKNVVTHAGPEQTITFKMEGTGKMMKIKQTKDYTFLMEKKQGKWTVIEHYEAGKVPGDLIKPGDFKIAKETVTVVGPKKPKGDLDLLLDSFPHKYDLFPKTNVKGGIKYVFKKLPGGPKSPARLQYGVYVRGEPNVRILPGMGKGVKAHEVVHGLNLKADIITGKGSGAPKKTGGIFDFIKNLHMDEGSKLTQIKQDAKALLIKKYGKVKGTAKYNKIALTIEKVYDPTKIKGEWMARIAEHVPEQIVNPTTKTTRAISKLFYEHKVSLDLKTTDFSNVYTGGIKPKITPVKKTKIPVLEVQKASKVPKPKLDITTSEMFYTPEKMVNLKITYPGKGGKAMIKEMNIPYTSVKGKSFPNVGSKTPYVTSQKVRVGAKQYQISTKGTSGSFKADVSVDYNIGEVAKTRFAVRTTKQVKVGVVEPMQEMVVVKEGAHLSYQSVVGKGKHIPVSTTYYTPKFGKTKSPSAYELYTTKTFVEKPTGKAAEFQHIFRTELKPEGLGKKLNIGDTSNILAIRERISVAPETVYSSWIDTTLSLKNLRISQNVPIPAPKPTPVIKKPGIIELFTKVAKSKKARQISVRTTKTEFNIHNILEPVLEPGTVKGSGGFQFFELPQALAGKPRLSTPIVGISIISPLTIGGLKTLTSADTYAPKIKSKIVPIQRATQLVSPKLELRGIGETASFYDKSGLVQNFLEVSKTKTAPILATTAGMDFGYTMGIDTGAIYKADIKVDQLQKSQIQPIQKQVLEAISDNTGAIIPIIGITMPRLPQFEPPPERPPVVPLGGGMWFGNAGAGQSRRRGKGYAIKKFGILDIFKGIEKKPKQNSKLSFL